MLRIRNLRKYYGEFLALDDVSIEVEAGQVVGFLGPNGAGKSTTMKIVTGFVPSSGGTVHVDGLNVDDHPLAVRRRIGYLPEHTPLYTDMKVREFLTYRAKIKGVPRRRVRARVDYVLERCWITDRARQSISTLSKGYRQRVGIADALVGDPKLLILDEPTIGLDPNQIRKVRDLVRELSEKHTVVLSTHILAEVEATCDRVIIIANGKTVADDTLSGLLEGYDKRRITVVLDVDETTDKVRSALLGLDGVEDVLAEESGHGSTRQSFSVVFQENADPDAVAGAISGKAAELGWSLLRLTPQRYSLESIFMELTMRGVPEEAA